MAVKLKDVAQKAGVSITAASMVLNNKNVNVSDTTRAQILQAARDLGYIRRNSINSIALMVPDLSNLYNAELTHNISLSAQEYNYHLSIFDANNSPERECINLRALRQSSVKGLIMSLCSSGDDLDRLIPYVQTIQEEKQIPIILLNRSCVPFNCHTISTNNYKGGYLASSHLLELGHRKIGCITGPIDSTECRDRESGFRQAFINNGIPFDDKWIINGDYTTDAGIQGAQYLMDQGVTAIFAQNDMIAFGVYHYLRSKGLRVPEDISLVGFDNISLLSVIDVPLTTVSQPIKEIGNRALNIILKTPYVADSSERVALSLQPELVVRGSTAAPAGK